MLEGRLRSSEKDTVGFSITFVEARVDSSECVTRPKEMVLNPQSCRVWAFLNIVALRPILGATWLAGWQIAFFCWSSFRCSGNNYFQNITEDNCVTTFRMFASSSRGPKGGSKDNEKPFQVGLQCIIFDSVLNIEMAVLSHGNAKMIIDHHLISIALFFSFLYKTLFELLPSSLGKNQNVQETGVHLFGKKTSETIEINWHKQMTLTSLSRPGQVPPINGTHT